MKRRRFRHAGIDLEVSTAAEPDRVAVSSADGERHDFSVSPAGDREWRMRGDDPSAPAHRVIAVRDGRTWWVHVDGRSYVFDQVTDDAGPGDAPRDSLTAPIPATVVDLLVEPGVVVERGDVLMVLAAMKMQLEVTSPDAGVVSELPYGPGDQVDGGAVLAVIRPHPEDED